MVLYYYVFILNLEIVCFLKGLKRIKTLKNYYDSDSLIRKYLGLLNASEYVSSFPDYLKTTED